MIDRLFAWLERLPGHAVVAIGAFASVLAFLAHLPAWITGSLPVPATSFELLASSLFIGYFLSIIVVLDGIARSAFDEFRPALGVDEDAQAALRRDLTSIPDRVALPAMLVFPVVIGLAYSMDPVSVSTSSGMPPSVAAPTVVLWLLASAAVALVVVHTIRQLRAVGRLHALADSIDPLAPGPTNAFSKLTAATAVAILGIGVLFAIPETPGAVSAVELVAAAAFTLLAIGSFVVPLRGMHGRLAGEKNLRIANANTRLKAILARLHAAVDSDDLARADELQKTQAALLAERELYARLSTWPWSQGTFRGFASAVILPILLGIVLRFVTRYL